MFMVLYRKSIPPPKKKREKKSKFVASQVTVCYLGLPGVKKAKLSVIKKFVKAPPHRQWAPTAPMPDITPAYPTQAQLTSNHNKLLHNSAQAKISKICPNN